MGLEKWIDLVVLILVLLVGTTMSGICLWVYSEPIATNYEDKSTVQSMEAIVIDMDVKTGRDILMGLVVTDALMPYPRAIQINETPVIRMTDDWVVNKNRHVAEIYNPAGQYKLGSMLDWEVEAVTFVHDAEGDYLKYTLRQRMGTE